ncbi:MAG: type III polyketide synthase [Phycisphaeraceae bacterium]|nr:type III polyketide synthase [Phycisphaeraceae bacterium]
MNAQHGDVGILGLGTATPRGRLSQEDAAHFAVKRCARNEQESRWLLRRYGQSGVSRRHVAVLDADSSSQENAQEAFIRFYPEPGSSEANSGPSTEARMRLYERSAPALAAEACREAIETAGVEADSITHLITVSCTGAVSPGLGERLIPQLGLSATVGRASLGFMGCHGGFNAVQVARKLIEADARACCLICCAELCSLHFQYGWDPQAIVANALFGDGASSMVIGTAQPVGSMRIVHGASRLIAGSGDAMTWRIGDHGFRMTLSPEVPKLIETHLRVWVEKELSSRGLSIDDVEQWLSHPGGPAILEAVERSLKLKPEVHAISRQVLDDHGNMSSATLGFLLERGGVGKKLTVALGFGPGLVAELLVLHGG